MRIAYAKGSGSACDADATRSEHDGVGGNAGGERITANGNTDGERTVIGGGNVRNARTIPVPSPMIEAVMPGGERLTADQTAFAAIERFLKEAAPSALEAIIIAEEEPRRRETRWGKRHGSPLMPKA